MAGNVKTNKQITVALAGNPNSGKTSLFNELADANQKVGNWSGVTIEKYEGQVVYKGFTICFVDLPGTYSLTAYSPEEVIARNFIIEQKPDIVINVIDGTNLERSLNLTLQLMELEVNLLIALNMYDEVEKQQTHIDEKQLQLLLGCHVIPTSATKRVGMTSLLDHIVRVYKGEIELQQNKLHYSERIEERIIQIENLIRTEPELVKHYIPRWLAIKLLENDNIVYQRVKEYSIWTRIERLLMDSLVEFESMDLDDPELLISEDRDAFIRGAVKETVHYSEKEGKSLTDYIDQIVLNRYLGLPIFLFIMWSVFHFTFTLGEAPMRWIETFFHVISQGVEYILPNGRVESIIVDGVIAGVGGVIVFLPNILLLFIGLSILEATGYMARAAFVVDKIMHKVGLHGKSFLPMVTGFGCSIPAIMATRTLKNRGDRLVTMMIIPFMSCGAKLPVYVLLTGAFFSTQMAGNVLFGIYLFGVVIAIISARLLKSVLFNNESEPFVMELPPYRMPSIKSLWFQVKFKAKMYLKKAGTIILVASLLIWVASNFPHSHKVEEYYAQQTVLLRQDNKISMTEKNNQQEQMSYEAARLQLEYSIAGRIGKFIEPVIAPIGFDWRTGVAIITGLSAKEVVVSTLSTIYSLGGEDQGAMNLSRKLQQDPDFTRANALSLMVFVLLYIPCVAAISVFRHEAGSWKWVGIYSVYSLSVAYISAFVVYRLALLLN